MTDWIGLVTSNRISLHSELIIEFLPIQIRKGTVIQGGFQLQRCTSDCFSSDGCLSAGCGSPAVRGQSCVRTMNNKVIGIKTCGLNRHHQCDSGEPLPHASGGTIQMNIALMY